MARCDHGYLCDVCGEEVDSIRDSDLYLRFVTGVASSAGTGRKGVDGSAATLSAAGVPKQMALPKNLWVDEAESLALRSLNICDVL